MIPTDLAATVVGVRWAWATAVGLIAACGPEVTEEEPACEELRQQGSACEQFMQCAGCFSVDDDGVGTCRGVLTEIDEREMAAALAVAVSARDHWKTACPERVMHLDRHAAYAVAHAAEYEQLEDLKEALGTATDEEGIEIRVNSGCNESGQVWGGLDSLLRIDPADPAPTCCVGPDCTGADFRCEWPATEGAPTPCVAAD